MGFDVTDLRIRFFAPGMLDEEWECNQLVRQLFLDFKKAYVSLIKELLNNILIEFWAPVILVRLIKMCLH
jgi:hypothetical protein